MDFATLRRNFDRDGISRVEANQLISQAISEAAKKEPEILILSVFLETAVKKRCIAENPGSKAGQFSARSALELLAAVGQVISREMP